MLPPRPAVRGLYLFERERVCVCVLSVFPGYFIDVWVIPCVQLCKINSRIKHQMTEIYWAQRDHIFASLLVV